MDSFEGYCSGGPYDGQFAQWHERECKVATHFDPPLTDENPLIRYGAYRFNLGKWVWSEENATHPG